MNGLEEFRAKFGQPEVKKGAKPVLRGTIKDYKGVMQVSLWANPDFKELVKEAIKEVIDGK